MKAIIAILGLIILAFVFAVTQTPVYLSVPVAFAYGWFVIGAWASRS